MCQKLSKASNTRLIWMCDRIKQGEFDLIWRKGVLNMGDYCRKHHPPWHHQKMQYKYLHQTPGAYSAIVKNTSN